MPSLLMEPMTPQCCFERSLGSHEAILCSQSLIFHGFHATALHAPSLIKFSLLVAEVLICGVHTAGISTDISRLCVQLSDC